MFLSRHFDFELDVQADQRLSLCQPLRRVHRPLPVPLPLPGKGPQGRHGTLRQGNLAALLQGPSSDGHKCPGSPDRIKVEILGPNFTKILTELLSKILTKILTKILPKTITVNWEFFY